MINQIIEFKSPIKVVPSKVYYLVIEDADGIRHYFHHKHENEYGNFAQGQYDGYDMAVISNKFDRKTFNCDLCNHTWCETYFIGQEIECPHCKKKFDADEFINE